MLYATKTIITLALTLIVFVVFTLCPALLHKLPESAAIVVVELFGAETQEQVADIEMAYRLLCSFFAAVVLTVVGFIFKRQQVKPT